MFDPANTNYPMTNYALHQSSFQETYTERVLNVSRPQLNETDLDPDVYLNEASYIIEQRSHTNSNSYLLLQGWNAAIEKQTTTSQNDDHHPAPSACAETTPTAVDKSIN